MILVDLEVVGKLSSSPSSYIHEPRSIRVKESRLQFFITGHPNSTSGVFCEFHALDEEIVIMHLLAVNYLYNYNVNIKLILFGLGIDRKNKSLLY